MSVKKEEGENNIFMQILTNIVWTYDTFENDLRFNPEFK